MSLLCAPGCGLAIGFRRAHSGCLSVLPSKNQRTIITAAAHLSGFVSLVLASAYTCKAMALSFAKGAAAGAVLYLLMVVLMWE